jgi:tryptophanyl-tRNA synthetase
MARDIGQRFNHIYGGEYFTLPEAAIEDNVATLPGLDGRKMSKSYNNTIPLWLPAKELRKAILGIVTNSQAPGEPKNPDESHIFSIYQAFASSEETAAMRKAFADGIGWGDAKQKLFERIDSELAPMRERYEALIAQPGEIEKTLKAGAQRARALSQPLLARLRKAVGLRPLEGANLEQTSNAPKEGRKTAGSPKFIGPYREDGGYKFRLENGQREHLFVSIGYNTYSAAAQALQYVGNLRRQDIELGRLSVLDRPLQDVKETASGNLLGAVVLNGSPGNFALMAFFDAVEFLRSARA